MATQLKHTDIRPIPVSANEAFRGLAPRPNVRVAFIAGEATAAVHDAMAKLPQETRDGTLDDLVPNQRVVAPTWDQAVTALAIAIAARDEFHNVTMTALDETMSRMRAQGQDDTVLMPLYLQHEATYDGLVHAVVDATYTLGMTPAPGARGLAEKVRALADDEFHLNKDGVNELVAALDRDAKAILSVSVPDDVELIQSMTGALIEKAQELLSPRVYSAFLRWGEAASHASTLYQSDEEGTKRCKTTAAAGRALGDTSAENVHDVILKTLVVGIEAGDCPAFGPFTGITSDGELGCEDTLLRGLSADLDWVSPVPALFNELSVRAWELSAGALAFSETIGRAITGTFSFARGLDSTERDMPTTLGETPAGYDPFMRGPLIQWQRRYARYEDARDALRAYDRDVHTPTFAQDDVTDDRADAVQAEFDALLAVQHDALLALYRAPAPSTAELAIKLKLFDESVGWELTYAPEAIRQIMIDARRFGRHGAYVQTDQVILSAFRARRHEMYATASIDLSGPAEEAYFASLDTQEKAIHDSRATTLEGVIAKLRIGFRGVETMAWSDHAIGDTNRSDFREGLRATGFYERTVWSGIEDLARIAGVNLAEQGV